MSFERGMPVTFTVASLTSVILPSGLMVTNGSRLASIRLLAYWGEASVGSGMPAPFRTRLFLTTVPSIIGLLMGGARPLRGRRPGRRVKYPPATPGFSRLGVGISRPKRKGNYPSNIVRSQFSRRGLPSMRPPGRLGETGVLKPRGAHSDRLDHFGGEQVRQLVEGLAPALPCVLRIFAGRDAGVAQGQLGLSALFLEGHGLEHFLREASTHPVGGRRHDVAPVIGEAVRGHDPLERYDLAIETSVAIILALRRSHTEKVVPADAERDPADGRGEALGPPPAHDEIRVRPSHPDALAGRVEDPIDDEDRAGRRGRQGLAVHRAVSYTHL